MTKLTRTGMVIAVFLLGCATSRFVVPPATAQNAQKWDYFCFDDVATDEVTRKAKEAGKQGWELVSSAAYAANMSARMTWCFKRPM